MNTKIVRNSFVVLVSILLTACQGVGPNNNVSGSSATQAAAAAYATLTALPQPTGVSSATQAADTPTQSPILPTQSDAPILVASGPTDFPANLNPLTGLPVREPTVLNRRPVMIKVSNWPVSVRPQSGLSAADLVFEYYIGSGMNRFLGLFYSQDTAKVGSVRSGRLIDAQLAPLYQAVLASSGAYVTVEQAIDRALGNRVINEGVSAGPMFSRDPQIASPNNLFADTAQITKFAQSSGADPKTRPALDGMAFSPVIPVGGQPAAQVAVQYNYQDRGEWRYDTATGAYRRWIESADASGAITMVPLSDANTQQQLAFSNVVVLFALHHELAATMYEVDLNNNTAGRKALLFRDGQAFEGTWKSARPDQPLRFFTGDGQPMAFKPGSSWIAIMAANSGVTEEAGNWTVQFALP